MAGPGRALGGRPGGRGGGDSPLAMIRRGIEALKLELNAEGDERLKPIGSPPPPGGALGMPKLIGGEIRLPPRRTTNTKEYQDYQDWADMGARYRAQIDPVQDAPPHMRPDWAGNALNMPRLWGE